MDELRKAIESVVDYNWGDELDDYRENEESRPSHIFRHLVMLDNFINGTQAKPEDYL